MRRRDFIAAVGCAAIAFSSSGNAQQVPRIGLLFAGGTGDLRTQQNLRAFAEALAKAGWIEGRNIHIEYRWSEGDLDKMRAFAKELVELQLEVFIGVTTRAADALRRETTTLPIVFIHVSDPVGRGFVASLARPAGNMTGFIDLEATLGGKWVELLRDCAPAISRVGLMFNPDTAAAKEYYMPSLRSAAALRSFDLVNLPVRNDEEIESAVRKFASTQGAIAVLPDSFPGSHVGLIISSINGHRVPAIYPWKYMAVAGGLVSYGADPVDAFRKAPTYIDRILKGERPADLPVQLPTKFELVLNLRTANALGLAIPASLLARADEVIE
jgi:putative ABC transport system substrate-binding protein